jgi:hypothetical protein
MSLNTGRKICEKLICEYVIVRPLLPSFRVSNVQSALFDFGHGPSSIIVRAHCRVLDLHIVTTPLSLSDIHTL